MWPRRVVLACCGLLANACLNGLTGGRPDSGVDAPTDAAISVDAEAAADPGILCSMQRCDTQSQVCCKTHDGGRAGCYARDDGGCPANFTVSCTSSANCSTLGMAGDICCVGVSEAGALGALYCIDPPTCLATAAHRQVCDPLAPDCPDGSACAPASVSSGFFTCQ